MPEIPIKKILLHPATLFVGCVILIVVGSVALWEQNSHRFLSSQKYRLSPEQIMVEGARPDLADQLKHEILNELAGSGASTLDPNLVPYVAAFAESQPFVQASYVKKSVSGLSIKASFRQPVAVVELKTPQNEKIPVAVDAYATLLDGRIYQMQSPDEFLRISIDQPVNQGLKSWEIWPDKRIQEAAKICGDLQGVWKEFQIYRVVTFWQPGTEARSTDVFELWTKYGDKIIWSDAQPNQTPISAEQKITVIRNFIAENGPLDQLAGRKKLDVRTGQAVLTKDNQTAAAERLLLSELQNLLRMRKR